MVNIERGHELELTPQLEAVLNEARHNDSVDLDSATDAEIQAVDPEAQAILDRARSSEKDSAPRKHHLVPASYLRRWAEDRRLRVTDVNDKRSWTTSAEKAARETDYYSVASEDLDPAVIPPLLAETVLSEIEGAGKVAIDHVLETGTHGLGAEMRSNLATFMAFQYVRGAASREMLKKMANDTYGLQYGNLSEVGIRALLAEKEIKASPENVAAMTQMVESLNDGSLVVTPQNATMVAQSFQAAIKVAEVLSQRHWEVQRTPPILVTSDEPVVPLGGPGHARAERAGVANAAVIIFPLAPDALLTLFRERPLPFWTSPLSRAEIAEINHEVLANAARWGFERPKRKVASAFHIPPSPKVVKMVEHSVGGQPHTSIMRVSRPSRWANEVAPPAWPVARWYLR